MTNKRQIKKYVKYICGELAAELLIARTLYEGFDSEEVRKIVGRIAELQETAVANASFAFDKSHKDFENAAAYNKARAAYNKAAFGKLLDDFDKGVAEVLHSMNAIMPEALRNDAKAQ